MTFDQAKGEIDVFLAQFPFEFDPKVIDGLEADGQARVDKAAPVTLAYTGDQEFAMLAEFTRRMAPILDRRADEVRNRGPLILDGASMDSGLSHLADD